MYYHTEFFPCPLFGITRLSKVEECCYERSFTELIGTKLIGTKFIGTKSNNW